MQSSWQLDDDLNRPWLITLWRIWHANQWGMMCCVLKNDSNPFSTNWRDESLTESQVTGPKPNMIWHMPPSTASSQTLRVFIKAVAFLPSAVISHTFPGGSAALAGFHRWVVGRLPWPHLEYLSKVCVCKEINWISSLLPPLSTHLNLYIQVRAVLQSSHFGSRHIYSNEAVSILNAFEIFFLKLCSDLVFKSHYFQRHLLEVRIISSPCSAFISLICILSVFQISLFLGYWKYSYKVPTGLNEKYRSLRNFLVISYHWINSLSC